MSQIRVNTIQNANGTTGITFAANGQVTLANTPLQLTGGQIVFPATQIASADGNTLDDYEEGTWTPTDGSGAGLTFSIQAATYVKIGRLVQVSFSLTYPSTSSSSVAHIANLPFTVESPGDSLYGGYATYTTYTTTPLQFLLGAGSTIIYFFINGSTNGPTNSALSAKAVRGVIFYRSVS